MNEHDSLAGEPFPTDVSLLHVATVPAPIRNFYLPLAAHFRGRGWRLNAAARGCAEVEAIRSAFDGAYDVPFSRSLRDVRSLRKSQSAVAELMRELAPDIVHVYTPIASFVTRLAIRLMPEGRKPAVVYTAHGFHFYGGGNPLANSMFLFAERLAGRWTDRLIVINDDDETAARRARIVRPGRLTRMPGVGIDASEYSVSQVESADIVLMRRRMGIDETAPLFVSIGELHPNKRHERTIEALSLMKRTDVHLAIAGDGPLRGRLERAASRRGVADRVHLLGFLDDVMPLLAVSTGLVIASGREGLARSIMEALSFSLPVVASDARGNRELVGSESGYVVANGSPAGMAAAMDRLASDPDLAKAMGESGRRKMIAEYSQNNVIEMHERMYLAMLNDRQR